MGDDYIERSKQQKFGQIWLRQYKEVYKNFLSKVSSRY